MIVVVLVGQSCTTLFDSMDCSPPGSNVRWIFQAIILEWVAIPFSRASPQLRVQTQISCIAGDPLRSEPPLQAQTRWVDLKERTLVTSCTTRYQVTLQIRVLPCPQLKKPLVLAVPSRQVDPSKGSIGTRVRLGLEGGE